VRDLARYGLAEHDVEAFSTGLRRGSTLLVAEADDAQVGRIEAEFARPSLTFPPPPPPVEKTEQPVARAISGEENEVVARGPGKLEETAIPIVEERIEVSKRTVDRGGVRIVTRVVEVPFDTTIDLREEQVVVQRRQIRRGANGDELRERSISMHATGEVAEVKKTTEVVEEVVARKTASVRTQPIHDTLKRTEVEVRREAPRASRPSHP
jgi:stress response protein YsnF